MHRKVHENQTTGSRVPFYLQVNHIAFAAILLVLFAIPGSVASSNLLAQSLDLNSLIEGLQHKYSRMQGLEADFIQIYRGADGRVIREAGHLLLKRPSTARWEYYSPEPKLFVSDGRDVFFYVYG